MCDDMILRADIVLYYYLYMDDLATKPKLGFGDRQSNQM